MQKYLDSRWMLAATYLAYGLLCLYMQHNLWFLAAADRPYGVGQVLGLFAAALGAVALAGCAAPAATAQLWERLPWSSPVRRAACLVMVVLAVLAPAIVAYGVIDRFANSGDEFAYIFQAKVFTSGRLWAQAPPLGDTFVPYRTWIIGDKWLSQYPPGWPLALAAALAVGIPEWLLNALLGGGSAAALLSRLWRFPNRTFAFAVVGLYLLTPFYLFNAGSYYSHMLPALLVLLLCLTCLAYQRDKKILALVAAGALLGCIGLTRYFTLILLLPALCYWLFAENRGDRVRIVVTMLAAGLPFLGFLMAYQNWVTGSLLRSTYSLITNDDTFVSFTPDHIALGAALTIDRLVELSVWGSPLLIPVYLVCLASKLKRRSIAFYDLIFPAFIVGYVLFADLGGNRYGPRYYFDAYPVMLATVLSAIPREGADSWRRYRRSLAINAVLVSAVYLLTALPFACVAFHRQVEGREEPYRLAAAQNLDNALVIIETSSGRGLEAEDLARNDAGLRAPVLYARQGADPAELHRLFPNRSVWAYIRKDRTKPGRLERVSVAPAEGSR